MTVQPPFEDACDGFTPGCLDLTVRRGPGNTWLLGIDGREIRCAVGRSGVTADKREGDGATPIGRHALREAFYRADRIAPPQTSLKLTAMARDNGWCDDPADPNYNRPVKLPYPASHEEMWRDDHVYDLVVVIGYNDAPPVAGRGSAIFLHLCRDDFAPTAGCVAIPLAGMLQILPRLTPETAITVEPA
jgi:L,D-peptidoglycan transpeptidase YkuD (ErfK/YbiS/YcfS/YnhG family)